MVEGRRPGLWADRLIQGLSSVWVQVGLREERFVRLSVLGKAEPLKIGLVNDVPSRELTPGYRRNQQSGN